MFDVFLLGHSRHNPGAVENHKMKSPAQKLVPHVALLRGINVGGNNIVPMKALADIFANAGAEKVRTYIQSGNVIFEAQPNGSTRIATKVGSEIEKHFGFRVPVVVRTAAELHAVAGNNPFLGKGATDDRLYVMFLADTPDAESVRALDTNRSPTDKFVVRGPDVYLCLPSGVARTKLTNAYFDSKLKTVSTMRNWRTVLKLLELMAG